MNNSQQQPQQQSDTDDSRRVGASPLHHVLADDIVVMDSVESMDSVETTGRVGIVARKSEDDACAVFISDEEERPTCSLSLENEILESDNTTIVGTILLANEEDEQQQQEENHQGGVVTTTEPSTELEPSSSLLRRNVIVSSSSRPSSAISQQQQEDEDEHFSDDLQSVDLNQNDTTTQGGEGNIMEEQERTPELSPFDYDTNWDMVGHAAEQSASTSGRASSLLAEAAAATAMLATTTTTRTVESCSSPELPESQQQPLQGIAPPQHPSSEYNYNVCNWDMTAKIENTTTTNTTTDALLLDDNDFVEPAVHDSSVGGSSSVSSLAEAAAATALLKGTAATETDAQSQVFASEHKDNTEDDPLRRQPKPKRQSRSSLLFNRPTRQQVPDDAHYYYSYTQQYSQQDDNREEAEPTSGGNLESVLADNGAADNSTELVPTSSFQALVGSSSRRTTPETRSEMNESIRSTSTSSSSAGAGGMSNNRRRRPSRRRLHHHRQSRSSSSSSTTSSLRSRRSSSERVSSITEEENEARASSNSNSATNNDRRLRASLDSGMAAVRRWVRTRGQNNQAQSSSSRSSRAARRWQSQHGGGGGDSSSALQLGDEDLFALAHAGELLRHYDDSSVTEPTYFRSAAQLPVVQEVVDERRQRSLSEPDGNRLRDFFFDRNVLRRRNAAAPGSGGAPRSNELSTTTSSSSGHLQAAALSSSIFHSTASQPPFAWSIEMTQRTTDGDGSTEAAGGDAERVGSIQLSRGSSSVDDSEDNDSLVDPEQQADPDPNRQARARWIRINRRFQLIITLVALIFSLLLFAILVCWVVLTSAYVVSIDKDCDVGLKAYFWLATFQLILDVFRTDIMRVVFRWDTNSRERIPVRVIVYNIAYLTYAMLVLRLGVRSVFFSEDATCPETAPQLFNASTVFVILSISAWSIIVLGYLVPFCFVAILLTWNGYNPASDGEGGITGGGPGVTAMGAFGNVFPVAYSNSGAPPGCIDQLRVVMLEEFPDEYPRECCICMGDFCDGEVIVATACDHVFHKLCCQEWLRQARTCPVCRTDIPSSLATDGDGSQQPGEQHPAAAPASNRRRLGTHFSGPPGQAFGREEFHQEVVNLFRILRQHEERRRQQRNNSDTNDNEGGAFNASTSDVAEEETPQNVET